MDYDFQSAPDTLRIPIDAFQPVKRCPFCYSVFINELTCETCSRSMLYHPIGVPFEAKSFYGIKERYVLSLNIFFRLFPQFENHQSILAKSYVRKLSKRLSDLIAAFNSTDLIALEHRSLFCIESKMLIDELLSYGVSSQVMQVLLEENDSSLIGQELLYYLQQSNHLLSAERPWMFKFLNYSFLGLIKTEFALKVLIISMAVVVMAVNFKEMISSQFGK
jgi:hypothetical protein